MWWCARLAGALLVASAAGLHFSRDALRDQASSTCGFAHYGHTIGSAQSLAETQLAAGVADWHIVVPMPPPCTEVSGVDMRVCDADEAPGVVLHDALTARVHRSGSLASPATVNVTVYCILPQPDTPASLSHYTETTFKSVSKDVRAKQNTFNKEQRTKKESKSQLKSGSNESVSIDLTSVEQVTTVRPTASTTTPPPAPVEYTLPTKVVTPPPKNKTHFNGKLPHSVKVTIDISPHKQKSTEEDVPQSYDYELPLLPNKIKSSEEMSSLPYILTRDPGVSARSPPMRPPPDPRAWAAQNTWMPGTKYAALPAGQNPEILAAQGAGVPGALCPAFAGTHYAGMNGAHHAGVPCSQHAGVPCAQHGGPPCAQHAGMPPAYELMSRLYGAVPGAYSVAPLYRPTRFLDPRLRFLQRRRPLLFFRRFSPNVS